MNLQIDAVAKHCPVRGGSISDELPSWRGSWQYSLIAEIVHQYCCRIVQIVATNLSLWYDSSASRSTVLPLTQKHSGLVALGGNVGPTRYGNRVIGYVNHLTPTKFIMLHSLNTITVNGTEVASGRPFKPGWCDCDKKPHFIKVITFVLQSIPRNLATRPPCALSEAEHWTWKTRADLFRAKGQYITHNTTSIGSCH